jgi:tetratricopeptide (TPR) repeat protein/class 3 adenylate cyclase
LKNLIPYFIEQQHLEDRSQGHLDAYTLCVDLSGFTPLTEALMREGSRGAEQLTNVLNEIFEPLVRLVYARGGFIPYFAGDAFTAIFPAGQSAEKGREIVHLAMLARHLFSKRAFRFGNFTIGIKFGLSFGRVEWGIVGAGHRKSFYFRGAPIDGCAQCQVKAKDQDIVADWAFCEQVQEQGFHLKKLEEGFYKVWGLLPEGAARELPQAADLPELNPTIAYRFLPKAVANYRQEGEFRTVISVFISFKGVENHDLLEQFATIVLEEMYNFSGYFKEVDFGDKGGVMVGFFGAPVSFENNSDRALEFIFSLRERLRPLQAETPLQYRVGVTMGVSYTGIVGGQERCQYAAVGNRVNLAARLMTYAKWGEVLVDDEMKKNRHFNFQHRGDIHYKGFEGKVPTYKLIGRNYESRPSYLSQMVGREIDLEKLMAFVQPIFEGQPAGLAYVYGEAGVGKSRLMHELKQLIFEQGLVQWHTCQADQILRKPFNPFLYFLRNYFEQYPESSSSVNKTNFESRYQELLKDLESLQLAEAKAAHRELRRTKTVLAALIGLSYEDSIWELLDAKGRYQNTLASIVNLFVAEALLQPLLIEIEDSHWLDENSRELLTELVRQLNRYPIALVMTSRYRDDGSKPLPISWELVEQQGLPELEVDLNTLQPDAVKKFAELSLGGDIHPEFQALLLRASNSNPFYLEQILEYFVERSLLEKEDGLWTIKDKDVQLSSSINTILTARIDRLSALVKETVKAAAVIGREFDLPILSEVMKTQNGFAGKNGKAQSLLREQVKRAERGQIWHAMNELRYIFRHALLREAVYDMQLRTRLEQLHGLIAQAIERLYSDQLEERYADLAFHYEQANVFDKTCEYLQKAADYARSNYQNQQALDYYEKLLDKLSKPADHASQIRTYLNKGRVLELIGDWDACQDAYERALHLAKESRDVLLLGQANNNLGKLLLLKGDYVDAMGYLRTGAGLFESIDDRSGKAKVYGSLGELYFRQGKYNEAKEYFEQSLATQEEGMDPTGSAQVAANLGLTHMNQGNYDDGIHCQLTQLAISERYNDKQGMANLHTNLGIVYFEKGDYDEALESYQRGLALSEELGNKHLTAIAVGCIGSVYERKGDYPRAMEHFQEDLELCEELGDKQGTAIALGLIGELYNIEGHFPKAIEHLQKNLMLCEELGYQKGIAKALNTLGDVFYFTEQYDRSLHFYNRAIEVTRLIDNKLVLGASLAEKGLVLLATQRLAELAPVAKEALEVAQGLGNPDLLFEAMMLKAKQAQAEGRKEEALALLQSLLKGAEDQSQEAAVYYELWRLMPSDTAYKLAARERYETLCASTPKYIFKKRFEELSVPLAREE